MDQPIGHIKVTVSIPITERTVSPADCPTADDVMAWLTDEYLSPVGLLADFGDDGDTTMIIVWQDGQAAKRWTAAAGWTSAHALGCASNCQGDH